jgi:hypothetical protein
MSPEKQAQLFERWPTFFANKANPLKSAMYIGFDCGDGWKQIIWSLFSQLELLSVAFASVEPFEVEQVKQKFGELRVYTNWSTDKIEAAIEAARLLSRKTCEICGQSGILFVSDGWWATRCVTCAPEVLGTNSRTREHGPQVAVFWLFRSRLILQGTDLDNAEPWGEYLNAQGHKDVWAGHQREGHVTASVEYDCPPRGRVVFDSVRQQFHLYADRCILDIPELVAEILRRLNLPSDTPASPDDHYRCARCMGWRQGASCSEV